MKSTIKGALVAYVGDLSNGPTFQVGLEAEPANSLGRHFNAFLNAHGLGPEIPVDYQWENAAEAEVTLPEGIITGILVELPEEIRPRIRPLLERMARELLATLR